MSQGKLNLVIIDFGEGDPSFWGVLKKSLEKKYKLEFKLALQQIMINDGNDIVFYEGGRIALQKWGTAIGIKYTEKPMEEYLKFKPNTIKEVESSDL